ncbi:phage head closure protein [Patescibacteria group bacterium]|nr:phage head closure protein [Patescibacteria group bacterium]
MDPGKINNRITLQAPTIVRDDYGGETKTWTDVATVWANVKPLSGKEMARGLDQYGGGSVIESEISHRVWIRFRRDIRTSWRLKFGYKYLDIQAVINIGSNDVELEVLCLEQNA